MRVVRHPDPTDAVGLVRKIARLRPTVLVGTPTFVSYILDRADAGRPDLAAAGHRRRGEVPRVPLRALRGAGPAARRPRGLRHHGVFAGRLGQPAGRATARHARQAAAGRRAVRSSTWRRTRPLPPGGMGMLLVSGPTVFPGYLGYDGPSPFREHDGKRWYVTGDLGEIDADGYLRFRGRLKRFLKAGGEMISLPALEEPFARLYPPTKDGPRVAVEGVELDGGRRSSCSRRSRSACARPTPSCSRRASRASCASTRCSR